MIDITQLHFWESLTIVTAYSFALWAGLTSLNSHLVARIDWFEKKKISKAQKYLIIALSDSLIKIRRNCAGSNYFVFIIAWIVSMILLIIFLKIDISGKDNAFAFSSSVITLLTLTMSALFIIADRKVSAEIASLYRKMPRQISSFSSSFLSSLKTGESLSIKLSVTGESTSGEESSNKSLIIKNKTGGILVRLGAASREDIREILELQEENAKHNRIGELLVKHKNVPQEIIDLAIKIRKESY